MLRHPHPQALRPHWRRSGAHARTGAPLSPTEAMRQAFAMPTGTGGAMFGFTQPRHARSALDDGDEVGSGSYSDSPSYSWPHSRRDLPLRCRGLLGHPPICSPATRFCGQRGTHGFPWRRPRALAARSRRSSAPYRETIVHPGHGPDTTIGRERRVNPFFPRPDSGGVRLSGGRKSGRAGRPKQPFRI